MEELRGNGTSLKILSYDQELVFYDLGAKALDMNLKKLTGQDGQFRSKNLGNNNADFQCCGT